MQRFVPLLLGAWLCACADLPEARPSRDDTARANIFEGGVTIADAASADDARADGSLALHDAAVRSFDAGMRPMRPAPDDPCEGATATADDGALHAEVAALLTPQSPCGFSACHAGSRAKAGLRLTGIADLRAQLVDKPACEAPSLPLVDGTGGAQALARSWLWQKLVAPSDQSGALLTHPAWGSAQSCGQAPSEPFGMLMPLAAGALPADELAVVRRWICAGAPGPHGAGADQPMP